MILNKLSHKITTNTDDENRFSFTAHLCFIVSSSLKPVYLLLLS